MTKTRSSLVAAATLVLSTTILFAQSAPTDKPSPYEGVSTPPANDTINTSEQAPAIPPAAAVPAPPPAPAPAAAQAPAPAASSNPDAGIIETPLPPSVGEY